MSKKKRARIASEVAISEEEVLELIVTIEKMEPEARAALYQNLSQTREQTRGGLKLRQKTMLRILKEVGEKKGEQYFFGFDEDRPTNTSVRILGGRKESLF